MWRSMFLAIGFYLILLGSQLLTVDRVVLKLHERSSERIDLFGTKSIETGPARTLAPPPWVPWTLMTSGAVTCLYSFTIPRRAAG
jgi:hypothetical protein